MLVILIVVTIIILLIMFSFALVKVAFTKSSVCPQCERKFKGATNALKCPHCKHKLYRNKHGQYMLSQN